MISGSSTASSAAGRLNKNFSAATPIYADPSDDLQLSDPIWTPPTGNVLNFVKHIRLTDAQQQASEEEQVLGLAQEMDQMMEEEFDEAAVPTYQMI